MPDIAPILSRYLLDCRPTQIDPLGAAGGMSGAKFWRIIAPRGTLILRCWPQEHPEPDRLRFIHGALQHAAQRGITILPVPIRATSGDSFVEHAGHLWELAPWMSGTADYERAPSAEKLQAAMQALAKFHTAVANFEPNSQPPFGVGREAESTPLTAAPSPAIQRRLSMLQELNTGEATKLSKAITSDIWPDLAPLAHQFLTTLPTAIPHSINQLAPLAGMRFPLQPCLRDIWHDHILFIGNEVTGIVDFGAMAVDTPSCDVARLLGSLVGDDRYGWENGLAAYSKVRTLSADEIRAVTAFDTSGALLAGRNWLRWIYVERREFENPAQVLERFRRIVARCAAQSEPPGLSRRS